MYIKFANLLLISACIALASCRNTDKYAADSKHFGTYLEHTFGTGIPKDSTTFVLVSEYGCHGCIEGTIEKLHNRKNVVFILSKPAYNNYVAKEGQPSGNYKIDTSGEINRLKYHGGNVGIVQTSAGNIYNTAALQTAILDSQLNVLIK